MSLERQKALDYLARKGTQAPLDALRAQVREAFTTAERAFDDVPVEFRGRRPSEGKWSPHEILDHLVLSHQPAVAQMASAIKGDDISGGAIPEGLHRSDEERPAWETLRTDLANVHEELVRLLDAASDATPLTARVPILLVVKSGGETLRSDESLDWKAFAQALRAHTLEHLGQLKRAVTA